MFGGSWKEVCVGDLRARLFGGQAREAIGQYGSKYGQIGIDCLVDVD